MLCAGNHLFIRSVVARDCPRGENDVLFRRRSTRGGLREGKMFEELATGVVVKGRTWKSKLGEGTLGFEFKIVGCTSGIGVGAGTCKDCSNWRS